MLLSVVFEYTDLCRSPKDKSGDQHFTSNFLCSRTSLDRPRRQNGSDDEGTELHRRVSGTLPFVWECVAQTLALRLATVIWNY